MLKGFVGHKKDSGYPFFGNKFCKATGLQASLRETEVYNHLASLGTITKVQDQVWKCYLGYNEKQYAWTRVNGKNNCCILHFRGQITPRITLLNETQLVFAHLDLVWIPQIIINS